MGRRRGPKPQWQPTIKRILLNILLKVFFSTCSLYELSPSPPFSDAAPPWWLALLGREEEEEGSEEVRTWLDQAWVWRLFF